jgi:hypothetical protein
MSLEAETRLAERKGKKVKTISGKTVLTKFGNKSRQDKQPLLYAVMYNIMYD